SQQRVKREWFGDYGICSYHCFSQHRGWPLTTITGTCAVAGAAALSSANTERPDCWSAGRGGRLPMSVLRALEKAVKALRRFMASSCGSCSATFHAQNIHTLAKQRRRQRRRVSRSSGRL